MSTETAIQETPVNGNSENQQIAVIHPSLSLAEQTIAIEERKFALAQRQARVYSESSLVPQHYRNNIGNVLIAQNMSKRMGADLLMVMQNLYVVHGNPGWSSQYLIATFNSNGRFSAVKYRFKGEVNEPDWGCQAYCTELATGDEIEGTWVTWQMANAEGWVNKSGSKWKTMPEQMFRYRSAAFMIRATAPEIAMGLLTKEELEDVHGDSPNGGGSIAEQTRGRLAELKNKLIGEGEPANEPEAIEGEIVPAEPVIDNAPPADTDEAAEASQVEADEAAASDADPLESLSRADVQAALDGLMKDQRLAILNGRKVKDMDSDTLNQTLIDIRKAAE